ncbi:MAG TPA: thioredoxin family protein [Rhizomicrobium sp.]
MNPARQPRVRLFRPLALVLAALLTAAPRCPMAFAGVQPPRVGIRDLSALAVPEAPFDRHADAPRDVAAAFARAGAAHKLVLLDLGANWCADCRILAGIMELPEVRRFLDSHYVVVNVDVGRFDRNLQIPKRFGFMARLAGLPAVLIAEPGGVLVNAGHTDALLGAGQMQPQAVVDWLASWAR